jgi:hypothetical protein
MRLGGPLDVFVTLRDPRAATRRLASAPTSRRSGSIRSKATTKRGGRRSARHTAKAAGCLQARDQGTLESCPLCTTPRHNSVLRRPHAFRTPKPRSQTIRGRHKLSRLQRYPGTAPERPLIISGCTKREGKSQHVQHLPNATLHSRKLPVQV